MPTFQNIVCKGFLINGKQLYFKFLRCEHSLIVSVLPKIYTKSLQMAYSHATFVQDIRFPAL